MALHWNLERCSFTKEWQKENWNAIESMIWLTMVIDVGEITPNNLEMVEYRTRCYEIVSGRDYTDVLAILPKLIGMTTNVHTTKPKEFGKRMLDILDTEVKERMRYAKLSKKETDAVT